jgi:hypothetical protein
MNWFLYKSDSPENFMFKVETTQQLGFWQKDVDKWGVGYSRI